jgi:hypothetical protein
MILLCKKGSHGVGFMENKGAYCCLTTWRAKYLKSCAVHLQQPQYHYVCRPYWLWQHAGPKRAFIGFRAVFEEEEGFYKFLPANTADRLCQLWQSCSNHHEI